MRRKSKNVEFLGISVKIDNKEIFITKENCCFMGWEYINEDLEESDSGVDLDFENNNKTYHLSL